MSWINTLRTPDEDLGTLAKNNSCTGYEPNDHFITEPYVEYTQEALGPMTWTTMTSPSLRRSFMRAEDEIQHIRAGRPAVPIFEHELVPEAH